MLRRVVLSSFSTFISMFKKIQKRSLLNIQHTNKIFNILYILFFLIYLNIWNKGGINFSMTYLKFPIIMVRQNYCSSPYHAGMGNTKSFSDKNNPIWASWYIVQACSELHYTRQFKAFWYSFFWLKLEFCEDLVPTKGTSQGISNQFPFECMIAK